MRHANGSARPEPGEIEERSLGDVSVEAGTRKLRGVVPYGQRSKDLGGWFEVIEDRALHGADLSDLVVTVDHQGLPLGRYPGTLELEDRSDGLHWSCEPPRSRQDVVEAVERGDLKASSWRMVVADGGDRWEGNTRYVSEIRSLRDVAIVTLPAYASATAELRSAPEPTPTPEPPEEASVEEPEEVTPQPTGGLTVEARSASDERNVEARILDAIRTTPRGESRSLTLTSADPVTQPELSTYLWDLLRDSSVVLQSGVRVTSTTRKSVKWPTLTADIGVDFYDELDEIAETDPAFDEFELTPKKIAGLVRSSDEAFEDSEPSLATIIEGNLSTVIALRFDRACLVGDTAVTPKGFDGLAKLAATTVDLAGAALDNYDPFIEAFGALAEAHIGPPYAVIMHPRTDTSLSLVKEFTTSGSNVGLPRPANFPPTYVTSQIGLTTGASPTTSALVYAPRLIQVVRRLDTEIIVDRSAAFTSDAVLVRGRVRAVIGSQYPRAIALIKGIAASPIAGVTTQSLSAGPQAETTRAATSKK